MQNMSPWMATLVRRGAGGTAPCGLAAGWQQTPSRRAVPKRTQRERRGDIVKPDSVFDGCQADSTDAGIPRLSRAGRTTYYRHGSRSMTKQSVNRPRHNGEAAGHEAGNPARSSRVAGPMRSGTADRRRSRYPCPAYLVTFGTYPTVAALGWVSWLPPLRMRVGMVVLRHCVRRARTWPVCQDRQSTRV
jgi:hypothetical protein